MAFALYNILKLRVYLLGVLDKDQCYSTDLKTEQLFVLYLWIIIQVIMISRILGINKIHSIT